MREVLTTLRSTAPPSTEYRHPLARYSFRAVYADSANRGRAAQKDLGTVYSRDILGEPGTLTSPAPRLLTDVEAAPTTADDDRTLEELRFVPGDYLCVMVQLPKNVTLAPQSNSTGELTIKGSGAVSAATPNAVVGNGWKKDSGRDSGWGSTLGSGAAPLASRGGGHWRGASDAPSPASRGRGGRGSARVPPPRRESPPRRAGWGGRRRSQSLSRSRSPPKRRNSRYD